MQSSSLSIRDALSAEEVCPLCLDHYTAADECVCVVCRAPSCPSCAEAVDSDGAMRCFACRPAGLAARAVVAAAARPSALPRPIPADAYAPREPPPLPFPLTTSPHGVRALKPRPTGSVFVGLPPVPPALARVQRTAIVPTPSAPPPPPVLAVPFRQRARAELAIARLRAERAIDVWTLRASQRWQSFRAAWPSRRQQLAAWYGAGRGRIAALPRPGLRRSVAFVRASLTGLRQSELGQRGLARIEGWRVAGLARLRGLRPAGARLTLSSWLGWARAQRARLTESAGRWARPIANLSARALPRPKSSARQADPSRPISL